MIRVLSFFVVVFALGLGFAWLADRPGDMVVTFSGYQYQVSLIVAAVAVVAVVAAVMLAWWLVKSLWNSPYFISRYFRVRRRDRGYQALSTGMIAAGAGDAALARKMNKQAAKLIRVESEPLIALLDAQASLLEGDHAGAREKFERMLDDPETRLLGLRGLYLEAERLGDRGAARHYAGRAADLAPQLVWAADSTIEEKVAQGDWPGALTLVDAQRAARHVDRETLNRRKAVLLTAKAQDLIDTDPAGARAAAVEANRLAPGFVPAALVAAKVLFRQNDTRKGAKILEGVWRIEPHPQIGDLYVHARPGDATHDRLKRAEKLQAMKTNNVESALVVARTALDAHEYALARRSAEAAIRLEPREAGYLLLADIEEADGADQGRIRQYLSKAVRAPRDPAWVADGFVSDTWLPISPVTGRLDAFEWKVPMERVAQAIEHDEPVGRAALAAPEPALATTPVAPAYPAAEDIEPAVPGAEPVPSATPEPAAVSAVPDPIEADGLHVPGAGEVSAGTAIVDKATPGSSPENTPAEPVDHPGRLPDDPGVDPKDRAEEPKRFRLF